MIRGLASLLVVLIIAFVTRDSFAANTPAEEFNGPFASWRQVQCSGQDDTLMLQSELDTLGHSGSPVLYINPGTCRITSSLKLSGAQYVTVLGHDAADTRITYSGAAGQPMLELNGVGHSRFGRLTWDGGGLADEVYFDAWVPPAPYFPTALRHEDEVFQNLRGDGIAVYLGAAGGGSAETTWIRTRFIGPADAGLFLANYNVLNQWVWDSVFDHTARGITNYIELRANGAGSFAANRSAFLNNSEADLETGNVANPYGDRWNYSRGGTVHVFGQAIGSAAPGWTSQGNVILDAPINPISLGSAGPLGLIDNTFRGGKTEGMLGVAEAYAEAPTGDLWAIGNTFSNPSPNQYAVPLPKGRFVGLVDDRLSQTIDDPGYAPATAPPNTLRPLFEPGTQDNTGVQNAIAAAAACGQPRCVVHLPYGKYNISQTVTIPAGSDMQLEGDGLGATILQGSGFGGPILVLEGPSRAVVRDLMISAQGASEGLSLHDADQTGGLVHGEDILATGRVIGVQVDGLGHTAVDLLDFQTGGESATPGSTAVQLVNGAKTSIFNGALGADTLYDIRDGSELVSETIYEEAVSQRPVSVLAPGGAGTLVLDAGRLHSYSQGSFDASTFSGTITAVNLATSGITFTAGPGFLGLGTVSDSGTLSAGSGPYAWWQPRQLDGAGSKPAAEQTVGVADSQRFFREHLAPLRAAKPHPLEPAPGGATDVRLYRIAIDTASTALRFVGGH